MKPVKISFEEDEFEVSASTMQELKDGIGEELGTWRETWSIYQFGILVDDENSKLEDLIIEGQQLMLNLVITEDSFRDATGKARKIKTDKKRFLVKGKVPDYQILEITPDQPLMLKSNKKWFFSGKSKESFGLITGEHIPGQRDVQFDVYEVTDEGHIELRTNDEEKVEVFLVTPKGDNVKLESNDTQRFDEKLSDQAIKREIANRSRIGIGIKSALAVANLGVGIAGLAS